MSRRKWLPALALIVAGCATMGGYQPTVDPYNDPYAGRIPRDEAECRELALHGAGGHREPVRDRGGGRRPARRGERRRDRRSGWRQPQRAIKAPGGDFGADGGATRG